MDNYSDTPHTQKRPVIGIGVPYVRFRFVNVSHIWYNYSIKENKFLNKRKESPMTFTYKIKTGDGHVISVLAPANIDPSTFVSDKIEIINIETVGVSNV